MLPNYTFKDKKTNKEWTDFLSISNCDTFLEENPDVEVVIQSRAIVSGIDGHYKPDEAFKDMLGEMKKANPNSKINDWR